MGGGMDLPHRTEVARVPPVLKRTTSGGSITYSDYIAPMPDDSLRHASFNGIRLRTGFVFAWGGAPCSNAGRKLFRAAYRSNGG